jgi:hypothetical protein
VADRCVSNDDDLQQGLLGSDFDFVMELCHERPQLFEKGDANRFEIRLRLTVGLELRIHRSDMLDILIQANRFGIGGELPLGCTEKDADVAPVKFHYTGRDRIGFDGLIERGENDGVSRNINDDAATCEIGHNFIFTLRIVCDYRGAQASGAEQNSDQSAEQSAGL